MTDLGKNPITATQSRIGMLFGDKTLNGEVLKRGTYWKGEHDKEQSAEENYSLRNS